MKRWTNASPLSTLQETDFTVTVTHVTFVSTTLHYTIYLLVPGLQQPTGTQASVLMWHFNQWQTRFPVVIDTSAYRGTMNVIYMLNISQQSVQPDKVQSTKWKSRIFYLKIQNRNTTLVQRCTYSLHSTENKWEDKYKDLTCVIIRLKRSIRRRVEETSDENSSVVRLAHLPPDIIRWNLLRRWAAQRLYVADDSFTQ